MLRGYLTVLSLMSQETTCRFTTFQPIDGDTVPVFTGETTLYPSGKGQVSIKVKGTDGRKRTLKLREVTLKGSGNWEEWIDSIRSIAENDGIWEFVDPDVPEDEAITLSHPEWPSIRRLYPDITSEDELTLIQKDELKEAEARYAIDAKRYYEQERALRSLNNYIYDSISRPLRTHIRQKPTPADRLRALQQSCAPSDIDRERRLEAKLLSLRAGPRGKNLDWWLSDFERTIQECQQQGMSEAGKHRAVPLLYELVKPVIPEASTWVADLLEKKCKSCEPGKGSNPQTLPLSPWVAAARAGV